MQIHVVKRGETLWRIAQQYGAHLNQIILVNQIKDPSVLVVGESLVIPDPNREYIVQAGDNFASIALAYGVSTQELAQANNIINPASIFVGEMLEIPSFTHVVQAGETLWSIAKRYGITVEQIAQANHIQTSAPLHIGQTLTVPSPSKPITEVNSYITEINEKGRQEVLALGRYFTYLAPFMYSIKEDGTITEMQEAPILEAAKATNTAPLLVLTNFRNHKFDSDLVAAVLRNPTIQETLITNLITKMKAKGYTGLNIDFEYVFPEDRENYNAFLRRLVARLHPEGLTVSTALAPKENAEQPGLLYEAHDYAAHGEIVDFVVIMTYEWGWAGGRPLAIAPINKVRNVLDFAVTVIPREKILMGIPLYGRDWKIPWVQGTLARTISPNEAVQLAAKYKVSIEFNDTYQSPFFRYVDETGQEHEVWFEDARSMQVKYDTVKEYGLRGSSYWVLGNPFPQNWPVLQSNFRIRKL